MVTSYLPSAADLYGQAQQQLQGYGQSQRDTLQASYQSALGMGMQSLASSGLAGTTIAPSMRMGYMRQYQQALNSLHDSLSQARLGAMSTFGLGGIQSEQAQQGLDISRGNLAINQQHAKLAKKQLALQEQNQGYQQNLQTQVFNRTYGADPNQWNNAYQLYIGSMRRA